MLRIGEQLTVINIVNDLRVVDLLRECINSLIGYRITCIMTCSTSLINLSLQESSCVLSSLVALSKLSLLLDFWLW